MSDMDKIVEETAPVDGSFLDVSITEEVQTQNNEYTCDTCTKVFRRKHHLVRHLKTHDPEAVEIRCSDCNIFFEDFEKLSNHNRAKHHNLICDICGILFKRRRDMERHREDIHDDQRAGTSSETVCPFDGCRKVFYRKTKYQDHINTHTKVKPYECGICEKTFSSKYGRNYHQSVCNNSKKIKCPVCDKVFQHDASLYNHKLAAHSRNSFMCGCGASYKYRSGLLKHRKSKNHQ